MCVTSMVMDHYSPNVPLSEIRETVKQSAAKAWIPYDAEAITKAMDAAERQRRVTA